MKKIFLYLIILLTFLMADEVKILTESSPPFNYLENGEVKGFATEIVKEILKRVGHPNNIELINWSDAYNTVLNSDNYALYLMTRSKQRENLFKWVGPIFEYEVVLLARADSNIKIQNLQDAKKVGAIGTYRDDYTEQLLKSFDFTNLKSARDDFINAVLLEFGEIDLWITNYLSGIYHAKSAGVDMRDFKVVYKIESANNYIAFSKNVSNKLIRQWQKALDEIKMDGTYEKIKNKFFSH